MNLKQIQNMYPHGTTEEGVPVYAIRQGLVVRHRDHDLNDVLDGFHDAVGRWVELWRLGDQWTASNASSLQISHLEWQCCGKWEDEHEDWEVIDLTGLARLFPEEFADRLRLFKHRAKQLLEKRYHEGGKIRNMVLVGHFA